MDGFRAAAFAKLNGDSTLTDMLATTTSIYHNRAPLDAAFPFIIFSKNAGSYNLTFKGAPMANQVWLFKGVDKSPSASRAEDIDRRIDTVLSDASLILSDGSLLYLRRESDVNYEDDTDAEFAIHHIGGLYRTIIDRA